MSTATGATIKHDTIKHDLKKTVKKSKVETKVVTNLYAAPSAVDARSGHPAAIIPTKPLFSIDSHVSGTAPFPGDEPTNMSVTSPCLLEDTDAPVRTRNLRPSELMPDELFPNDKHHDPNSSNDSDGSDLPDAFSIIAQPLSDNLEVRYLLHNEFPS